MTKRRQRGAAMLIPVVLIVTLVAFAVVVAATQSGGDIEGTYGRADSVEALFLAETGIERAARRFLAGSACNAAGLGEALTNLSSIGLGTSGRTITISAGPNSGLDFGGTALPATRCRIQVTTQIARSGAVRTLQAIIDRTENLIGSSLIAGFDNPGGATNPAASWTGPAPVVGGSIGGYDYTGGNTGVNPPGCTRSAYLVKPNAGGGTPAASTVGTAPVSFTISRPTTVLVDFDYRIIQIRDLNNNTCATNSGAASCTVSSPVLDATSPETAGNGDGEICFTLRDSAGVTYNSTRVEVDAAVDNSGGGNFQVGPPACAPTNQQLPTNADFTPCSRRYNNSGGAAATARVRFTFAGAVPLSFDQVGFKMYRAGGGNAFEMWLDNIRVTPNATIAGIAEWRDCAVSSCPPV